MKTSQEIIEFCERTIRHCKEMIAEYRTEDFTDNLLTRRKYRQMMYEYESIIEFIKS